MIDNQANCKQCNASFTRPDKSEPGLKSHCPACKSAFEKHKNDFVSEWANHFDNWTKAAAGGRSMSPEDIEDYRPVAQEGLLRALASWDKSKSKFSTYAPSQVQWHIKNHMKQAGPIAPELMTDIQSSEREARQQKQSESDKSLLTPRIRPNP